MDKNIILIPKEDKVYELKRKGNLVVTCENNSNNNNVEVIQKSFCENNNIKEGELFHLEDINECLNAKSIIKTPKGNTFIASKIIKASKNLLKEKSRQQNLYSTQYYPSVYSNSNEKAKRNLKVVGYFVNKLFN